MFGAAAPRRGVRGIPRSWVFVPVRTRIAHGTSQARRHGARKVVAPNDADGLSCRQHPVRCQHLQIELLRCHRNGDRDEWVERAIHPTINGVAAGLRNSG